MSVSSEDWFSALEILAGWDPDWDPATVVVNRVPCMPRNSLIQVLQDNISDKTSVYEIIRQLVTDGVIKPKRMTSRKDPERGDQRSFLVHEISVGTAQALYKELEKANAT